jgi:hypothetical protein
MMSWFRRKPKTKKQIIRDNWILTGLIWFYVVLTITLTTMLYISFQDTDYPTFSLYKDHLGIKQNISVMGRYSTANNHIEISLDRTNNFAIANTIYHEYGHYLHQKLLADNEVEYWEEICQKDSYLLDEYPEDEKCKEEFAFLFAGYIFNQTQQSTFLKHYNNTKGIKFIEYVFEKYIDEEPQE